MSLARNERSVPLEECTLYTTTYPCRLCANKIVNLGVEIVRCEITARDRHGLHCAWQAQCEIEVRRMCRQPDWQSCAATGSFTVDFDRFQRPIALRESATEVSD